VDKLRVLVVDDEPGMRLSIQKALRRFTLSLPELEEAVEFDTELAETGEEAVQKIRENRPDILMLDYKLPGMSGLDVLDRVRVEESEMVTIMITAYASIDIAITAIKQGAFDFIAKPFTPKELEKTVAKAAHSLILARQVRRLAEEKRQVRFQFISVLGHELKSPLNAVEGYLDQIRSRILGESVTAYEDAIARCLVRIGGMRKLIADLLDLTRIESGQKKRELCAADLAALADESIETIMPEAERKGIRIRLETERPFLIHADPAEIRMVLNNLFSNAVKYNREDGKVDVRLDRKGAEVRIIVRDTGIGISQAEAARLFQEFVRIKNENTRHIEGSGLGLTILEKITKLYGGEITVESRPGAGSTFTVILKDNPEGRP